ncbi:MAG: hypothetical protein Kow0063_33820 [Anaerolineae bacterium]
MSRIPAKHGWLERFLRWLFGAPFQELPPEFGDPVPAELRVYEYQAEEAQHHPSSKISTPTSDHHERTKPVRQDKSLERQ